MVLGVADDVLEARFRSDGSLACTFDLPVTPVEIIAAADADGVLATSGDDRLHPDHEDGVLQERYRRRGTGEVANGYRQPR